jgi:multidrug efflux pump subunit AcrA (membrane-fusion protein)
MIKKRACIAVLLFCLGLFVYLHQRSRRGGIHARSHEHAGAVEAASDSGGRSASPASPSAAQSGTTVTITGAEQQQVGIVGAPVEVRSVARTLAVAGQSGMDEKHTSQVGALADGRIAAVNVLEGDRVRQGTVLGELHSHMVHETVGALVQAYAAADHARGTVQFAEQQQGRYSHLYSIQAASLEELQQADQNLLQAKNQIIDAQASVRMEREHLSELLQVDPETLTPDNLYSRELVPVRSAIDGVVIARNVTVGQVVSTGYVAFVVTNLSTVWVTAAVNERDLPLIRMAAATTLTTQGYPDSVFQGRVDMIGDTLDPQTRTVPVRIAVPNPEMKLRPGMFASVQIAEPDSTSGIFVPEEAMQDINGQTVVFVTRDNTHFRAQAVNVGLHSGGKAQITSGLSQGDRIVVSGAFMVKSDMLKGSMVED